jgi:hypothetical protein
MPSLSSSDTIEGEVAHALFSVVDQVMATLEAEMEASFSTTKEVGL